MSKLILSIIFPLSLCLSACSSGGEQGVAWATTYYVDNTISDTHVASSTPDFTTYNHNTFSTTGGTDRVFKTVADVNKLTNLQPGDRVLFRSGITWYESLQIPASGTSGNMITFGTFGNGSVTFYPATDSPPIWLDAKKYIDLEGPFISDGSSSAGTFPVIGVVNSSDVIINNVVAQHSYRQPGISITLNNPSFDCNNVLIQNFQVTNSRGSGGSHGVLVGGFDGTYKVNNVQIRNGSVDDAMGAGVRVSGNVTNSLIDSVTTNNVSKGGPEWGIYFSGWRTVLNTGSSWTASGTNNEYYYLLTNPTFAAGLIVASFDSFALGSGVGTLTNGQYYVDNGTHRIYVRIDGTHSPNNYGTFIVHRWAANNVISHCVATNTKNPQGGDGHGIGFESGAKNCIARYNVSRDNGENGNGSGFVSWANVNSTFYYNVAYNNTTSGINVGGINTTVYNNTCYHNYVNGNGNYGEISFTNGATGVARNNIMYNGIKYGLIVDGVSSAIADHNLAFGNAVADWGGFAVKGPTDIEADPRVISAPSDFHLQSSSPAKWAGVNVGLTPDFLGEPVQSPPSIGAYEFVLISAPSNLHIQSTSP